MCNINIADENSFTVIFTGAEESQGWVLENMSSLSRPLQKIQTRRRRGQRRPGNLGERFKPRSVEWRDAGI